VAALACLRVVVEPEHTGLSPAVLGAVVLKFASAYLDSRWRWPRLFSPLTNYSFLLTDPRADDMDVQELGRMSDELQTKLFGTAASGEVTLLLFEGPVEAVSAFAALENAVAVRALNEPALLPAGGRLSQILGSDAVSETEREANVRSGPSGPPRQADVDEDGRPPERLHGVYFIPQGVFIGDVIALSHGRAYSTIAEGPDRVPPDRERFDADCVAAAQRLLADPRVTGALYIPISYDRIVRPSVLAAYEDLLSALPEDRKPQLTAAIYDVPRDPGFGALTQLKATLGKYFSTMTLRIEDPDFEIEKLATRAVMGVSLALPTREPRVRMSMLRQFASHRRHYNRKQIRVSVANVRTAKELEACAALGIPLVCGPAVSGMRAEPFGGLRIPIPALPAGEVQSSRERVASRA